jgi:Nucleotidyl transferase AbiEii toxin, Type IV TA system
MLYKSTVEPHTLALLKDLCSIPQLSQFALGGGTSIALQKGHRKSIDLDFFTHTPFERADVFKVITSQYAGSQLLFEQNQTMMFVIDGIKTDFILYPFEPKYPINEKEGVRLISIEDLIPMKLQAVSNRFAKKDLWDIEKLLEQFSVADMLEIFKAKFPAVDTGYIVHSLTNFENADIEQDPVSLESKSWSDIKASLSEKVTSYTEDFL